MAGAGRGCDEPCRLAAVKRLDAFFTQI